MGTEEESCETGRWKGDQDKLHFLTAAVALALHPPSHHPSEPAALSTLDWVLKLGLLLLQRWLTLALGTACCFIGEFSCFWNPVPTLRMGSVSVGVRTQTVILAALALWQLLSVAGFLSCAHYLQPISLLYPCDFTTHLTAVISESLLKIDFRNFSIE